MPILKILDAIWEFKIVFRGFQVYRTKKSTVYLFTSQPITRNALQCNGVVIFCSGRKIISLERGLWRPLPGEEKHLHLPQLQQDWGEPACIYLMSLFQIQIFCLQFSLASSRQSRRCSESSWSVDISGPFWARRRERREAQVWSIWGERLDLRGPASPHPLPTSPPPP